MFEYIFDFFRNFWASVDYGIGNLNSGIIEENINIPGMSNLNIMDYLTIVCSLVVGVLIVIALISFVFWAFKWFAGLLGR